VIDTLDELTPALVDELCAHYGSIMVRREAASRSHDLRGRAARRPAERSAPGPDADKIRFIDALVASGIRNVEITSFVSPKWIPQLADSAEVARGVHRVPACG